MDKNRNLIVSLWLLCALTACDVPSRAPQSHLQDQAQVKNNSANNPRQDVASDLDKQIAAYGSARVIIQLNIEGNEALSPALITAAQDRLIMELSEFEHKVIRRYSSLPMMVLEVDGAASDYLLDSPLVNSVQLDSLSHTMQ